MMFPPRAHPTGRRCKYKRCGPPTVASARSGEPTDGDGQPIVRVAMVDDTGLILCGFWCVPLRHKKKAYPFSMHMYVEYIPKILRMHPEPQSASTALS